MYTIEISDNGQDYRIIDEAEIYNFVVTTPDPYYYEHWEKCIKEDYIDYEVIELGYRNKYKTEKDNLELLTL